MKTDQMSADERKTYNWLVNKTKPELKRYRCKVIIYSIIVFLVVLGGIIWHWNSPTIACSTNLLIGGLLYAFWGALLLAWGAFSSPSTLGLMSMTRLGGNPMLFAELMKSRLKANAGIYFIAGGFLIQAAAMLPFGS